MEVFQKLGEELELRWRQRDYAAAAFPELAAALLEGADELEQVGTWEILRWIARAPTLPEQRDPQSHFSDLAITLYDTPRFFVSALVWLDGTTAIHQHSFSGRVSRAGRRQPPGPLPFSTAAPRQPLLSPWNPRSGRG